MFLDIAPPNSETWTPTQWEGYRAQKAEWMRQHAEARAHAQPEALVQEEQGVAPANVPTVEPGHDVAHAEHAPAAPAVHGSAHEGAAEHGAGHGPGAINWFNFGDKHQVPYLAYFINFAILVAILVKMGKKPVVEALVARRDKVAKDIEEAGRMKAEATARAATYKAQLDSLASDAASAKQTLLNAAAADKNRVVAEAEAAAVRMTKDAEFSVEQQRKTLAQGLHTELSQSITAGALAVLRSNVGPADHERLSEAFLADLERGHAAKGAA